MRGGTSGWAVARGLLVVVVALASARDGVAAPPADGPTLVLIVRDGVGEPVVGAAIVAVETEVRAMGEGRCSASAATDEAGRAELRGLRVAHGRHRLRISHRSFAERLLDDVHLPLEGALIEVVLDRGGTLAGRVVDATGEPAPRATVQLRRPGRGDGALVHQVTGHRFSGPHAPTAVTDEAGRFLLARVPPGVHGLLARVPGGAGWRTGVRPGGREVVIRLRRTHALALRSLSGIAPGFGPTLVGVNVPLRIDLPEDGDLLIPGLPPGRYVIRGLGGAVSSRVDIGDGSPGEIGIDLPAAPPSTWRTLDVRVVNPVGKPVPSPIAVAVAEQRPGFMWAMSPHTGDASGRVRLLDVPPGPRPCRVLAAAGGRIGLSDPVGPSEAEVLVRLSQPAGRLRVRVEDAFTGEVVTGATVRLIAYSSHLGAASGRTDGSGETPWFAGLAPAGLFPGPRHDPERLGEGWRRHLPGSYGVEVQADGPYLPAGRIVIVDGDTTVRIEIDPAPVRAGIVRDRAGRPAVGIRVGLGGATADTDARGRFVLRGRTAAPLMGPLRWAPFPGGRGSTLSLPVESDLEIHVIPDARPWPLLLRFSATDEGRAVRVNPGRGDARSPAQTFVDQEGIARPGEFLSGEYRVLLLDGLTVVREAPLTLALAPEDGRWIVDLRPGDEPR